SGAVLVVHGLGGMHLACDASNDAAVARLRVIKQRPHKPLAVLVASLAHAERLAIITPDARALLAAPAAPIVLLARRPGSDLATAIAPGTDRIGLMLAYSPLHHLLL